MRYDEIYAHGAEDEANDENLILRSFTDDPEIPLKQIRVIRLDIR